MPPPPWKRDGADLGCKCVKVMTSGRVLNWRDMQALAPRLLRGAQIPGAAHFAQILTMGDKKDFCPNAKFARQNHFVRKKKAIGPPKRLWSVLQASTSPIAAGLARSHAPCCCSRCAGIAAA
jgi:hypothetical protein